MSSITGMISKETGISEAEKQLMFKEMEQDVIEMQEITKRWQSDMKSDSWLSKNIRPLSLAFLTISLFIQIILSSSIGNFIVDKEWIQLQSTLLLLVYGGYFGARALEKVTKMRSDSNVSKGNQRIFDKVSLIKEKITLDKEMNIDLRNELLEELRFLERLLQ